MEAKTRDTLIKLRRKAGIGQVEFAGLLSECCAELGLPFRVRQAQVSMWESGSRGIGPYVLMWLPSALALARKKLKKVS